jgi:integrase
MRPKQQMLFRKVPMKDQKTNCKSVSPQHPGMTLSSDGRVRNPVELFTDPRRQHPKPAPADDVILNKLIAGITDGRDKAILMLLHGSGIRLSELVSLDRDTIQIKETTLPGGGRHILGVGRISKKRNRDRDFLVDLDTLTQIRCVFGEVRSGRVDPLVSVKPGRADQPRLNSRHAFELVP